MHHAQVCWLCIVKIQTQELTDPFLRRQHLDAHENDQKIDDFRLHKPDAFTKMYHCRILFIFFPVAQDTFLFPRSKIKHH